MGSLNRRITHVESRVVGGEGGGRRGNRHLTDIDLTGQLSVQALV